MRHSLQRGQAVVETALGMVAGLAVFVAAVHFAEIGFVGLKVEEAAAAAMWQSTEGTMHFWPVDDGPFDQTTPTVTAAVADVQTRYQDFDGLSTVIGSPTYGQMYTQASGMRVACATNVAPRAGTGALEGTPGGVYMTDVYADNKGLTCDAEANVSANALFPQFLLEKSGGGFFATSVRSFAANNIKICGVGRASGGTCTGKFVTMLDDWAGANANETGLCTMLADPVADTGCLSGDGQRYHDAVRKMFDRASNKWGAVAPAGSFLALGVVGWSPISTGWFPGSPQSESAFFMSSTGEDSLISYTQLAPPYPGYYTHFRIPGYGTSPGAVAPMSEMTSYYYSRTGRSTCFLGQPC